MSAPCKLSLASYHVMCGFVVDDSTRIVLSGAQDYINASHIIVRCCYIIHFFYLEVVYLKVVHMDTLGFFNYPTFVTLPQVDPILGKGTFGSKLFWPTVP